MKEYGQCYHTKYEGCPPCIHDAYRDGSVKGYLDGYTDAEKHYTNRCILCGTGGTVSWICNECKEEHPHWMGE